MVRNKDDLPYCRCVLGQAYCSYSVLTLPSFCVNNWSSIGLIWRVICASSKIRTRDHRTIRQDSYPLDHDASTWFIGIILWYDHIFTNGDDRWKGYQVRTWSSYASWSLFCGRFVDIQSFRCIFRKRRQWHWSIRPNLGEGNPRLCHRVATNFHYFTRYAHANQLSRGVPFHCMTSSDKSHVHTRIEQSLVFKINFQDLIRWTEMFV